MQDTNVTVFRKYSVSLFRAVFQTLAMNHGYELPYLTLEIWVSLKYVSCFLLSLVG